MSKPYSHPTSPITATVSPAEQDDVLSDLDQRLTALQEGHDELAAAHRSLVGLVGEQGDELRRLSDAVADLANTAGEQMNNYFSVASRYQGLNVRVEDLEAAVAMQISVSSSLAAAVDALTAPPPKPVDDINELILAYMRDRLPNQWTTPMSVASNIDVQSGRVDGRMLRMSREGVIERQGGQGRGSRPLYRLVVPTEE